MTWSDFYLVCFLVGLVLSLVSFLLGTLNLHFHWGGHFHLHLPHAHAEVGHAGHGGGHGQPGEVSPLNFGTLMAFLAWFGGAGFLLTRYSRVWFLSALMISVLTGVAGASIVFGFLKKVLVSREENLDPADYEMVGVLGRISSSIREGGTGELIFSQEGVRRTAGARSENGSAITKGTEVVVTRYERGIAYVRRWEEMAGEEQSASSAGTK